MATFINASYRPVLIPTFLATAEYNPSGGTDVISQAHTINAATTFLVIWLLSHDNNAFTTSGWSYGGVAMTTCGTRAVSASGFVIAEAFYIASPASGSQTIAITNSENVRAQAIVVQEFKDVGASPVANYNSNTSASATSLGVAVTAGGPGLLLAGFAMRTQVTSPTIDTTTIDQTGVFNGSLGDVSWSAGHSTFAGSNITATGSHSSSAVEMAGAAFRLVGT